MKFQDISFIIFHTTRSQIYLAELLSSLTPTTMVFTAHQQLGFFTANNQMGLTVRTHGQFGIEGIGSVDDLNWKPEEWDDFPANCRCPGQIPHPANPANLIHQAPFLLPV